MMDMVTSCNISLHSMHKFAAKLFVIFTIIGSLALSPAFASQTDCPEHFVDGQAPDLVNQKLSTKAQEVCYSGYALKHSGVTRTPLAYTRRVVYHHQDETFTGNREGFIKHCLYEMAQLDISSTANARTTGEILVALKRLMKPGEFTKLFEEKKVPFKHRAANNLMMLYRVTLNHPELLSLDRSIIYVLGTKGFKEEVWSLLAESGVGCYDIKYKEVLVLKSALQSGDCP